MPAPKRPKRVTSRHVFNANAVARLPFAGRIVGRYRRLGPNPWDDYAYEPFDGDPVTVLPGLKLHVEPVGTLFRMRHRGQVVVVRWQGADDAGADGGRAAFLERCVRGFANAPGLGASAAIAGKLRG